MTSAAPSRLELGPIGTDDPDGEDRGDRPTTALDPTAAPAAASATPVSDPVPQPVAPSVAPDSRSSAVTSVFDEIAPVYDRLASILSIGMERRWRDAVVETSGVRPGGAVIDVACGTGKLATVLADRVGPFGRVVALDLSAGMVSRGSNATRDIVQLEFLLGDAMALPFGEAGFDAATIAFGLGTLPDMAAGLRELRRVVRPGGRVVCLEPSLPRPRWWGRIYHRTGRRLAPLAVSVAGRREAYRQLSTVVHNVPDADSLTDLLRSVGLVDVRHRRLGLGAVAIHVGTVPEG